MRKNALLPAALAGLTLALAGLSGCVDDDPLFVESRPEIVFADAGCFFDDVTQRYIWYFDVEVFDRNGAGDIATVDAYIYDEGLGGVLADSVPLYPTGDPWFYTAEVPEVATNLDCFYGGYTVDVEVFDVVDTRDVATITPLTF